MEAVSTHPDVLTSTKASCWLESPIQIFANNKKLEWVHFSLHGDLTPASFILDVGAWDYALNHLRPKQQYLWVLHDRLVQELSSTRSALWYLSSQRRQTEQADYLHDGHWLQLIAGLLQQIELRNLRIDFGSLFQATGDDLKAVYHLLASAFQHALVQREGRLQSQIKISAKLVAAFCALLLLSFSIRNLIFSQRSWFLYHGSHPTDTLKSAQSWLFIEGVSSAYKN